MTTDINVILDSLEPKEIFSKFRLLTLIPRGSGNEKAISDFLRNWAQQKGLTVKQDSLNNLLIIKPGFNATSTSPTTILQAHLDMVCVSEPGHDFDFTKSPIRVQVDGDTLRAEKTTLGADDGIGVAFALALLDSHDLPHPPLEVVFTTDEETGMTGAAGFDASTLEGKYFINMDTEEEGYFYISCAGGVRLDITLPVTTTPTSQLPASDELTGLHLTVSGLKGGHSGAEIDKERGNSHRLAARVLRQLVDDYSVALHAIHGGIVDNAIPARTETTLIAKKSDLDAITRDLQTWQSTFRSELKASDGKAEPGSEAQLTTVEALSCPLPAWALTPDSCEKMLLALLTIPTGVAAMDLNRPEQILPETSSNLAIVDLSETRAMIRVSCRSQLASKKKLLCTQITSLIKALGGTVTAKSDYPGWEYDPDSIIRPLFAKTYEHLTGNKATILGIHAGLECGLFSEKAKECGKKIDFTSIGPNLRAVHSPEESLSISSTARTWILLKEVMAELAKQ